MKALELTADEMLAVTEKAQVRSHEGCLLPETYVFRPDQPINHSTVLEYWQCCQTCKGCPGSRHPESSRPALILGAQCSLLVIIWNPRCKKGVNPTPESQQNNACAVNTKGMVEHRLLHPEMSW